MIITILASWLAVGTLPAAQANPDEVDVIEAVGVGRARRDMRGPQARLMAERAAQVVAARNLLAKLNALQRAGVPGLEQYTVRGILRGHCYSATTFLADGTALVTAELPLTPQARARLESAPHYADYRVFFTAQESTLLTGGRPATMPAAAASLPADSAPH